jgi:hypothetical protein
LGHFLGGQVLGGGAVAGPASGEAEQRVDLSKEKPSCWALFTNLTVRTASVL